MSVSGINGGLMASMMIQMKQVVDSDIKDALTKANSYSGSPLGTGIDFSQPFELLSSLEQLKNEDPEKLKELMKEISETLKNDAAETTDESEAAVLTMIADKFGSAAESGDLTELQPLPPPPPNGGQQSKIAQYESNSGSQESLLEILLALLARQNTSAANSEADSDDKKTSVKELLSKALQELTEIEESESGSDGSIASVENILAEAIMELNGQSAQEA